jgi:hypothetical protein
MSKYIPLRNWSCPSYSASTGRAVNSSEALKGSYSAPAGSGIEPWSGNAQLPAGQPGKGSPTWKQIDANRTQGGSVKNRPVG